MIKTNKNAKSSALDWVLAFAFVVGFAIISFGAILLYGESAIGPLVAVFACFCIIDIIFFTNYYSNKIKRIFKRNFTLVQKVKAEVVDFKSAINLGAGRDRNKMWIIVKLNNKTYKWLTQKIVTVGNFETLYVLPETVNCKYAIDGYVYNNLKEEFILKQNKTKTKNKNSSKEKQSKHKNIPSSYKLAFVKKYNYNKNFIIFLICNLPIAILGGWLIGFLFGLTTISVWEYKTWLLAKLIISVLFTCLFVYFVFVVYLKRRKLEMLFNEFTPEHYIVLKNKQIKILNKTYEVSDIKSVEITKISKHDILQLQVANYKLNCVEQICKKQIMKVNKNKKSNVGTLLINFADDKIVVLHRILNIEDVRNKLIKIVNDVKIKNTNEKEI